MQADLGAYDIHQLTESVRRELPFHRPLVMEARYTAEPSRPLRWASQLGGCPRATSRRDAGLGRDLLNLCQGQLAGGTTDAFLQLGGALENERHLRLGVARQCGQFAH